jgi:hypothetical protein
MQVRQCLSSVVVDYERRFHSNPYDESNGELVEETPPAEQKAPPNPVIPCTKLEILQWFLAHTRISIIYANKPCNEASFPTELSKVAASVQSDVSLAIADPADLEKVSSKQINSGDTLIFIGSRLHSEFPNLIHRAGTPKEVDFLKLMDQLFSQTKEYKELKSGGREAIVKFLLEQALLTMKPAPGALLKSGT